MADIVAVDLEGVPLDEGVAGVDERRHGIVVEEQGVAADYLHIPFCFGKLKYGV